MKRLWRKALLAAVALAVLGAAPALAQDVERFGDTLAEVPVDRSTTDSINGSGEVSAVLDGNQLEVTGSFEGVSSPATAAHIHQGAPGQAGPVVFELSVENAAAGSVEGTVELSDEQIELLRDANLYVQIHTDQNPGGELRGWLWPR